MAGSTMLFACTKCHSRHKFDDLSKEEQLCKECRRKYPLVSCNYCQLEFHILKKIEGSPVCSKCAHNLHAYGQPKNCRYCTVKAAFKDKCCSRCISSEKKYGPPTKCQGCGLTCAFKKPQESQTKLNGQVLCLKCTFKFKKERYKQQKQHKHDQKKSGFRDTVDFGKERKTLVAPLKAENIHKSLYKTTEHSSRSSSNRPASPISSDKHDNNNTTLEPTFGDHMTELTSLREQIIKLNKVIAQKEKTILEKDKKISEFQAEQWEKDKLLRSKVQSVQKEYEGRIEQLQTENQSLRKQIKDFAKAKKTHKIEKLSSRIRLEPHKISLTPTSNRSPAHTPSKNSPEHDTGERTANTENESFENELQKELATATSRDENDDVAIATRSDDETADEKDQEMVEEEDQPITEEEGDAKNDGSDNESDQKDYQRQKSFDEVQAGEIKRLLRDDGEMSSGTDAQSSMKRGKKRKHKKRKSKTIIDEEDEEKDEYPSSSGFDEPRLKEAGPPSRKRKARKSKAFVEEEEEDEDDEPTTMKKEDAGYEEDNAPDFEDHNLQVDEEQQSTEESGTEEKVNTDGLSGSDSE